MQPNIIVWGRVGDENKKIKIYNKGIEKCYEQMNGGLLHYIKICEKAELIRHIETSEALIICTSCINEVGFIKQAIKHTKKAALIVMPHMEKLGIPMVLQAATEVWKKMLLYQGRNQQEIIALAGGGDELGEVLIELLQHLSLIKPRQHYEFYLKTALARGEEDLAVVEDLLKEYIEEDETFYVNEWVKMDKIITNPDYLYLLEAQN